LLVKTSCVMPTRKTPDSESLMLAPVKPNRTHLSQLAKLLNGLLGYFKTR